MEVNITSPSSSAALQGFPSKPAQLPIDPSGSDPSRDDPEVREAFQDFVGQTFFGQMLSAMRKTVGKPAYLHGGRTEEVFQSQLDQVLAEKLSDATAESFAEPMYELFNLPRL